MKSLNQKGAVDGMLIIALLLVLAFGAFAVSRVNQASETVDNTAVNEEAVTPSQKLLSYSDEEIGFSFDYPETWQLEEFESKDGFIDYDGADLTTESGNIMNVAAISRFGAGGPCFPGEGEVPHAAGNTCPTTEVVAKSLISGSSLPVSTESIEASPDGLSLIHI